MHISLPVFAKQNITVFSETPRSTAAWNEQRISADSCCLLGKRGWSLWSLPLLDNLWKIILSHNGSIQTADTKMRGFLDADARKNGLRRCVQLERLVSGFYLQVCMFLPRSRPGTEPLTRTPWQTGGTPGSPTDIHPSKIWIPGYGVVNNKSLRCMRRMLRSFLKNRDRVQHSSVYRQ